MTEAERQRISLLDLLLDGPVTEDHAHRIGIRRLSRRIGDLRHLVGIDIETVRGAKGTETEYRLSGLDAR